MILRDWQQKALDSAINHTSKRLIVSAPTGAGKAILLMHIIKHYTQLNKSVLLLVDRIALIDQLCATATKCGLVYNVIKGNRRDITTHNLTIASVQTYFRHIPDIAPDIASDIASDIICVDECHTMYNNLNSYLMSFTGRVFGVTATPYTIGLGKVYDTIINATTARILTDEGILVHIDALIMTKRINMDNAKTIWGEWAAKEVEERSAMVLGDVVSMYKQYAANKVALCFCATIDHCNNVAKQFTKAGINVGVYTSSTTIQDRQILLNKLDNHEITILISVAALSKGFDRQYIECILDLRPLRRSLAEYVQMIGRGIRSYPDKKSCLLLDFTGNFKRFAYDFERVFNNGVNSLDESERLQRIRKDNETDLTIHCPRCGYQSFVLECIKCNYSAKPIAIPTRKHITVDIKDIVAIPVTIPPSHQSKSKLVDKVKKMFSIFRF